VVVNASRHTPLASSPQRESAGRPSRAVIWHDLECGSYRADLPLWQELAQATRPGAERGRILDVGAGTGRVALELARTGHSVTALDLDPVLLGALKQRAAHLDIELACADARAFELSRHDFDLCVVPMNTIQVLGGSAARSAFLRRARAHLRPGGLLACAIVTVVEPFDCSRGDVGPSAETARVDGVLYVSQATRVSVLERRLLIERERRIIPPAGRQADCVGTARDDVPGPRLRGRPSGLGPAVERNLIELDRIGASRLEREAIEAALRPEPVRDVAPTDEHTGGAVVMFRA
jgi:SAM-dependent methyltransferase